MLVWLVLLKLLLVVSALDNGVGLTPPMGWLSWLYSQCSINCDEQPTKCLSEQLIKRTADRMASDGYLEAGYQYIIIDDCWAEKQRGSDGRLVPDKTRFKSGIKALADYVHSKGLKFGIYGDVGTATCQGFPGSAGHEALDAQTFADWGVDYVKLDGCNSDQSIYPLVYPKFGKALNRTGRPIFYSCSWPAYQECSNKKADYKAISECCNSWRNYGDIKAEWPTVLNTMDWFGNNRDRLAPYSGPGHFHDPDMLVAGYPEVSAEQALIQKCVWSILAAPLMISADLDLMSTQEKEILQDQFCISIQQDPAGLMGYKIYGDADFDAWARSSSTKETTLVTAYPRQPGSGDTVKINLPLKKLGLQAGKYQLQHIFNETKETVNIEDKFSFEVSSEGAKIFKLTLLKKRDLS